MVEDPHLWQWLTAFILMAVFTWVALDLLMDALPWSLLDKSRPGRRQIGFALIFGLGLGGYSLLSELLVFVWMGIKHVLLLDLEGL
jgi:hypothetical protein